MRVLKYAVGVNKKKITIIVFISIFTMGSFSVVNEGLWITDNEGEQDLVALALVGSAAHKYAKKTVNNIARESL